jgi:hypothetical protein
MAKRKKYDWEAIERDFPQLKRFKISHDEAGLVAILKIFYSSDRLEEVLNVPTIALAEFEYPLPRGRADLVLFHLDGTVSVVEIKGSRDFMVCAHGVGQAISYAVQIGYSKACNGIRKLLVAPVVGDEPETIILHNTCKEAGVKLVAMGGMWEHQKIWDDAVLKMIVRNGGIAERYFKEDATKN